MSRRSSTPNSLHVWRISKASRSMRKTLSGSPGYIRFRSAISSNVRTNALSAWVLARGRTMRLPAAGSQEATSSAASQPPGSLPWTPPRTIVAGPRAPLWRIERRVSEGVPASRRRSSDPRGRGVGDGAGIKVDAGVGTGGSFPSAASCGATTTCFEPDPEPPGVQAANATPAEEARKARRVIGCMRRL
jgi:hypothetical protein